MASTSPLKYTISAVIPTVQYGNLQPSVEVEASSLEEAHALAMPHIQKIWDTYGERPLIAKGGDRQLLQAFVGGEIYYDKETHTYTNQAGEVYLSGSQYAKQFEKPFDAVKISEALGNKFSVNAEEIRKMWELKGDISRGLGTMIHSALELYGRYDGLAKALEKTTHLHDHPIVKKAVESFYEGRTDKAEYEALIVDHTSKRAGRVDRLVIISNELCRIEDYKCNAEMTPEKLGVYWKQLDFYGGIMVANGWKIEEPLIHHWNGDWQTYNKKGKL